jgi:hypothetical protein
MPNNESPSVPDTLNDKPRVAFLHDYVESLLAAIRYVNHPGCYWYFSPSIIPLENRGFGVRCLGSWSVSMQEWIKRSWVLRVDFLGLFWSFIWLSARFWIVPREFQRYKFEEISKSFCSLVHRFLKKRPKPSTGRIFLIRPCFSGRTGIYSRNVGCEDNGPI